MESPVYGFIRAVLIIMILSGSGRISLLCAQDYSSKAIAGMNVGMGYGTLRSNDLTDNEFAFTPSYTKMAGFSLDIPIPALEERGTFYNELSFSQYEAKSYAKLADTTLGHPERDYYEISQKFAPNVLTLTHMFRYHFANRAFKYYVSIGIYNSFILSADNSKIILHNKDGVVKTTEEEAIPDHAVHGLMLIMGTGISYKYAGLEFRFDPGRNYTKKVDYSIHNPTVSAVLHVRFNP